MVTKLDRLRRSLEHVMALSRELEGTRCRPGGARRDTRIPVSVLLDALAEGMTEAEILLIGYPTLAVEGIRAAAAYGSGSRNE